MDNANMFFKTYKTQEIFDVMIENCPCLQSVNDLFISPRHTLAEGEMIFRSAKS